MWPPTSGPTRAHAPTEEPTELMQVLQTLTALHQDKVPAYEAKLEFNINERALELGLTDLYTDLWPSHKALVAHERAAKAAGARSKTLGHRPYIFSVICPCRG